MNPGGEYTLPGTSLEDLVKAAGLYSEYLELKKDLMNGKS